MDQTAGKALLVEFHRSPPDTEGSASDLAEAGNAAVLWRTISPIRKRPHNNDN